MAKVFKIIHDTACKWQIFSLTGYNVVNYTYFTPFRMHFANERCKSWHYTDFTPK